MGDSSRANDPVIYVTSVNSEGSFRVPYWPGSWVLCPPLKGLSLSLDPSVELPKGIPCDGKITGAAQTRETQTREDRPGGIRRLGVRGGRLGRNCPGGVEQHLCRGQ